MKLGDMVEWSHKNKNHLGNAVCAYAGLAGKVVDLDETGSFVLDCVTCTFVVPSRGARGKKRGCWVIIDGRLQYHKFTHKTENKPGFLNKLLAWITKK